MVSEKSMGGWYFLGIVIIAYIILSIIKPDFLIPTLKYFLKILIKIIPMLVIIIIIMFIINYFVTPKKLVKHLGKDGGAKTWIIAVITGIISTGPIYMWYPMLAELKEHGVRQGFIATFLYTRAIKPALIPLMILYFGLMFTIVLTIVMIIFSIMQGIVLEKIVEV